MTGARDREALSPALVAAVVVATLAAWIATERLGLSLLPLGVVLLAWALVTAPPHRIALAFFFLAIVVDNPKEHPAEGNWTSPIYPLGLFLYENLNNLTGVSALRFSAADVLFAILFLAALLRTPRRDQVRAPPALHLALAAAWIAVVWMEAWGLGRGGDFKASLWQVRPLFWAPVIAYVLAAGLRGPRDHAAVGKAVVVAAVVKAASGAYYYFVVSRELGHYPQYATTHSDSVLFVMAAVIAVAYALEARTVRAALAAIAILAPVLLGVMVNGRRLAYVSLVGSIAAMVLMLPPGLVRRTARRVAVAGTPVAAGYLMVGWSSDHFLFAPARKVASLFSQADRSALMRDIENFNLVVCWKQHLYLGTGFGHEYDELTRPEGMQQVFSLYRYIAHNSVLWLENAGGYVGFTAFWALLVVLAYFAARAYRFARSPTDRAAALAALSVVVVFGVQAYGDMGLNSWTAMYFLGMGLALSSKLAVATGAFPGRGAPILAR
jgi:hypothetical protein